MAYLNSRGVNIPVATPVFYFSRHDNFQETAQPGVTILSPPILTFPSPQLVLSASKLLSLNPWFFFSCFQVEIVEHTVNSLITLKPKLPTMKFMIRNIRINNLQTPFLLQEIDIIIKKTPLNLKHIYVGLSGGGGGGGRSDGGNWAMFVLGPVPDVKTQEFDLSICERGEFGLHTCKSFIQLQEKSQILSLALV